MEGQLLLKPGVSLANLTPQALLAMIVTRDLLATRQSVCMITSVCDGEHGPNSLHPKGRAFDFRIWYLPAQTRADVANALQARLGDEFDVVLEHDHIHVEWDPDYLKGPIVA